MEETPSTVVHWADEVAEAILEANRAPVISTGISPSGEIHVGNLREVVTADAIFRALRERGVIARFNYVCDDFDPLRHVYPFLTPERYGPLVGKPLSDIPCPCGAHPSYAEHFLEPFLHSLGELGVKVDVERASQMYRSGRMMPYVLTALENRDRIARILREVTGKDTDRDWSPFQPLCPGCGRITQARVTGFDRERQSVGYACACGASGSVPMAGGGKLTWRIDWPARWIALGVTVEPFGKDHATRGGSYDTGVRIVREVFGGEPPFPIPYEWVSLKGKGDMKSRKGNVLSIAEALELAPPVALRYLILREKPQRTISFDPGLPLLKLVDEVEDAAASPSDARALELARVEGFRSLGVPLKHLAVVAQAADFTTDGVMEILARTGYPGVVRETVADRMRYVRRWVGSFAPDDLRFEIRRELPAQARDLSADQRRFLLRLAEGLREGMDGEAIHRLVYDLAAEFPDTRPPELFQALYLALLGKPRGPRAGWFVELVGVPFCVARFQQAAAA